MIVTMVAFTSNAIANDDVGDNTEFVATELVATVVSDGDAKTVAIHLLYFYPDLHYSLTSNTISSKEGVDIPDIVSKDSFINSTNYANIYLPFEVGLLSETINFNIYNIGINYSEIHLPFEVGLTSYGVDNEFKDLPIKVGWNETNI